MFALLSTALAHDPSGLDAHVQLGTDLAIRDVRHSDVYALGETLVIDAPVKGDVSGMVGKVHVTRRGRIEGNLQVLGAEVVLDGPVVGEVRGAVAVLTLNASVGSVDAALEEVTVGRGARVRGDLRYRSKERVEALEQVVSGEVRWRPPEDGKGLTISIGD